MNYKTLDLKENSATGMHPAFEDLVAYIFPSERPKDYIKTAAKLNCHMMKCPECRRTYQTLLVLRDTADSYIAAGESKNNIVARVMKFLTESERNAPVETLLDECFHFKKWLSFSVSGMMEIVKSGTPDFSHPKLVTVMKSSTGQNDEEETESEIRSSLSDLNKNRVSIGLDGTLSLYFDVMEHPAGRRVIILPEDLDTAPQMGCIETYDSYVSYVRFENISPGQYTVVVQE